MRARINGTAPRGQILVLFVISLTAIFAMAALLFDGAHALVLRRQLQNASDTAALQASNLLQSVKGCSATAGPPPGAPRTAVSNAAIAAVQAAIPGTPSSAIHVSCPGDWLGNYGVEVDVDGHSPTFFGGAVGINGFDVHTTSQAVNGAVSPAPYSVLVLDNQTTGTACPSTLISGGPTITLEGSMIIDSKCPSTGGGGLGTNGNSATLTMNNSSVIKIQGAYVPGTLTISPTPLSGQPPVNDPLAGLPAMPTLTTRSASRLVLNNAIVTLLPGRYIGGIQLKNTSKAFLRPGIYVMDGGGFDIGSQAAVYSVASGVSLATDLTWATVDCPVDTCGVLLYNTNWSGTTDQIKIGAGATLKLRPYLDAIDTTGPQTVEYNNLLLWQAGTPAPPANTQPEVHLSGGGSVDISGTVYAPGANVYMTGGSGGSGGGTDDTLQFICWDLQIQGNSEFHFLYNNQKFAKPPDYGLVK
jgi:hypothetical protein